MMDRQTFFLLVILRAATDLALSSKLHVFAGAEVNPHEFPWMSTIISFAGEGGQSICGGSLVRVRGDVLISDVVLTAAHCVTHQSCTRKDCPWVKHDVMTVLGNHYLRKKEKDEVAINSSRTIPHPCWQNQEQRCQTFQNQLWFSNDVAVIILQKPVKFNHAVQPLDLPKKSEKVPKKSHCRLAGWGDYRNKTNVQAKEASEVLRTLNVTFMEDRAACAKAYGYAEASLEPFLCAQTEGRTATACQGDSGGPIWCQTEDRDPVVYGVVSANAGYCGGDIPAVFTNVGMYVDWVWGEIKKYSRVANSKAE